MSRASITDERELGRRIIAMVLSGEIASRDQLQRAKLKLSGEYAMPDVIRNSAILAAAADEERRVLMPLLVKKPVRTMSGVAVVAVMTSPHPCPHGKCSYCPGGTESPQSYTGKEPAARRASRNGFDPFLQVRDRIEQLEAIGHETDKIDLIIMGGTFTSRDPEYQEWFVRRCFDAMNGCVSKTIGEAQSMNETAEHRCIGLTVETRPDVFTREHIDAAMRLGATRVELGVQILDDAILESTGRGHGTAEIIRATRDSRDAGLKVCYHIMPGLPGSCPEKDIASFRRMFSDPDHRPDMLKIYTTLVIEGTKLHEMWMNSEYVPYDTDTAVALLAEMKSEVPEYVRIQRIQRDIPAPQIAAGILKSNIRELVAAEMRRTGRECRCVRCREAGHRGVSLDDPERMRPKTLTYEASGGTEFFISMEYDDALAGYVRLRISGRTAHIRELKVFGKMATIGDEGEWQHRGIGKTLMDIAERTAEENGVSEIRVTSGVGVRGYYRSLGYGPDGPYMVKVSGRGPQPRP
jgi:elongator complex protein 3